MSDDLLLGSNALQGAAMASSGRSQAEIEHLQRISEKNPEEMTDKEIREIATDFESLFVRQILKEMRKTIPKNGFLEESNSTRMYMEMGDDALAKEIAQQGGLGVADLVFEQLKDARDNLFSAAEIAKQQSEFKPLQRPDGKPNPEEFMPLNQKDDPAANAIPLQRGHDPIPLRKEKGFMPLDVPVIPLDKIERR